MIVLKPGILAYWDTLHGLKKCRVLSVSDSSPYATSGVKVTIKLLEKSSGFSQYGEIVEQSSLHVVPCKAVHRLKYSTRIKPYSVSAT